MRRHHAVTLQTSHMRQVAAWQAAPRLPRWPPGTPEAEPMRSCYPEFAMYCRRAVTSAPSMGCASTGSMPVPAPSPAATWRPAAPPPLPPPPAAALTAAPPAATTRTRPPSARCRWRAASIRASGSSFASAGCPGDASARCARASSAICGSPRFRLALHAFVEGWDVVEHRRVACLATRRGRGSMQRGLSAACCGARQDCRAQPRGRWRQPTRRAAGLEHARRAAAQRAARTHRASVSHPSGQPGSRRAARSAACTASKSRPRSMSTCHGRSRTWGRRERGRWCAEGGAAQAAARQ